MKNKLMKKLFEGTQARARPPEINASATEAHIYLYDFIGWGGIEAQTFVKDLSGVTAPIIHLHINSPGGDVFEARAIATAIKGHRSKIIAHIDGLAASAATMVAMAAAEIEMSDGGFFMIHQAWTVVIGNADDMRKCIEVLEKVDGSLAADYCRKTGKDAATVKMWMASETWFTASEALDQGFVDRVTEGKTAENCFDLQAYANVPKALTEQKTEENDIMIRARLERRLALFERT